MALCYRACYGSVNNIPSHTYRYPREWCSQLSRATEGGWGCSWRPYLLSGFFPQAWSESIIVPVFKKGNVSDPHNFRGISLISCFCKLFTSILNQRLLLWSNDNDIITDAQFGFQPNRGTAEAIFCLSTIIDTTLRKKKSLSILKRLSAQ